MPLPEDEGPSRRDFEHLSSSLKEVSQAIKELPIMMATIYLRRDVYEADQKLHSKVHEEQGDEIDDLKSAKEWAVRIVVGAFILGLAGLLWAQSR